MDFMRKVILIKICYSFRQLGLFSHWFQVQLSYWFWLKLSTHFLKYCFLIGLNSLLSFKNMFKITYNIKQILSKCRLFLNLVVTIFSVDFRNISINSFAERAGKSFICQDHMTLQNNNINFSRATLLLCCDLIEEFILGTRPKFWCQFSVPNYAHQKKNKLWR